MLVNQINPNTTFTAGKFITPEMHGKIEYLLTKMNSETKEHSNNYRHCSVFIKSLKYQNKAEFTDGRMIFNKTAPDKQMVKESFLNFDHSYLVINNKTGEIIEYDKPLLSSWKQLFKKAEMYLNSFIKNYDNSALVKKEWLKHKELTPEGEKVSKMLEFYV